MPMKASNGCEKRSSIAYKELFLCLSLSGGVLFSGCSDAKDQDPTPQNDTVYALPASVNAEVKESFQLGAQRVKGGLATNVSDKVTWKSSDEKVATVDATGKGTATGIGSATISTTYDGIPASVNVKVSGRITTAEVEAGPIVLAKGTIYKLATIGLVEDFSKRALTGTQSWGTSDATIALNGAILQMFNHGLSAAGMFFLVGVIYERTHTRNLEEFGGLFPLVPMYGGILIFTSMASLGLPGLNGFISEFLVVRGTWPILTGYTALSMVGLLFTGAYILKGIKKVLHGPMNEHWAHGEHRLTEINAREILVMAPLMALILWIGIYPAWILDVINKAVVMLF